MSSLPDHHKLLRNSTAPSQMCHDSEFLAVFGIVTHPPSHRYPRMHISTAEILEKGSTGVSRQTQMCHDLKFRAILRIVTHSPPYRYPRTAIFAAETSENGSTGAFGRAQMCHDPKFRLIFRIVTQNSHHKLLRNSTAATHSRSHSARASPDQPEETTTKLHRTLRACHSTLTPSRAATRRAGSASTGRAAG